MSLQETLEELRKQQEEQLAKEPEDELEEEHAEEEEQDTEPEEEPVVEEVEKPKPELDDAGYARLRREAAAAKKLAEEERRKREELEAKIHQPQEEAAETHVPSIHPEMQEILAERIQTKAEREFQGHEAEFRALVPDYDAIADQYNQALFNSIRIQNPRKSAQEIAEMTKKTVLIKASTYMQQGFNPIEELYHEAVSLGFTGQKQEEKPVEIKKPDLNRIAENKKRSSGFAGAGGRGVGGQLTAKAAADLTNEEWMSLSREEKAALIGR